MKLPTGIRSSSNANECDPIAIARLRLQPTLEQASVAHSTWQEPDWSVAGSALPQALIRYASGSLDELRLRQRTSCRGQ